MAILSRKNSLDVVKGFLLDSEKFVELVLDCSITMSKRTLQIDDSMVLDFEQLSRNLWYSLHLKRSDILGLKLR